VASVKALLDGVMDLGKAHDGNANAACATEAAAFS
jgi:hypothetical protein